MQDRLTVPHRGTDDIGSGGILAAVYLYRLAQRDRHRRIAAGIKGTLDIVAVAVLAVGVLLIGKRSIDARHSAVRAVGDGHHPAFPLRPCGGL